MERYNLVIVGGGILGSFAAYFSRLLPPEWKVALIEACAIGTGATRFSAGVHLPMGATSHIRGLAARSAEIYTELDDQGIVSVDSKLDAYWVAKKSNINKLQGDAVGFDLLEVSDSEKNNLDTQYPQIVVNEDEVLLRGGTSHCFDPPQVARKIVQRVGDRVAIYEGTRIERIKVEPEGTVFTTTLGENIFGAHTLLCNGPWLIQMLGAEIVDTLGLRIKKVAAIHLSKCSDDTIAQCALFFPEDDAYIVPLKGRSQYLLSFASREWDCEPDSSYLELSINDYQVVQDILKRRFNQWHYQIYGGRVFCDTYAADSNPIACLHPSWQNVAIAGAGGGAGFRLAPAIAERAMKLLLEGAGV